MNELILIIVLPKTEAQRRNKNSKGMNVSCAFIYVDVNRECEISRGKLKSESISTPPL